MDALELGLTCAQLRVLEVLIEHPDSNISEIARDLDLSRQAVHRVVHLLADAGFLSLEKNRRGDRRAVIPQLSETARFCAIDGITWQRNFLRVLTGPFRLHDLQFTAMAIDRIWRHFTPDLAAAEP
jgi:DNA-binding transcriptional ArsR family regulator